VDDFRQAVNLDLLTPGDTVALARTAAGGGGGGGG
jgi:hypothetical protein